MPRLVVSQVLGLCVCVLLPIMSCATTRPPTAHFDYFEPISSIDDQTVYPFGTCRNDLATRIDPVELDVPYVSQHVSYVKAGDSKLCWAACIAMVSSYLGNPRETCQIASFKAHDGLSCCRLDLDSPDYQVDACNQANALESPLHHMGIYHLYASRPLSEAELKAELSNGRPVVPSVELTQQENGKTIFAYHVVVISGTKDDKYHVLDPSVDGSYVLSYAELLSNRKGAWRWDATWYHFSFRRDGCNPRFNPHCDCSR